MLVLNGSRSSTLGRSRSERVLERLQDTCNGERRRRRKEGGNERSAWKESSHRKPCLLLPDPRNLPERTATPIVPHPSTKMVKEGGEDILEGGVGVRKRGKEGEGKNELTSNVDHLVSFSLPFPSPLRLRYASSFPSRVRKATRTISRS